MLRHQAVFPFDSETHVPWPVALPGVRLATRFRILRSEYWLALLWCRFRPSTTRGCSGDNI